MLHKRNLDSIVEYIEYINYRDRSLKYSLRSVLEIWLFGTYSVKYIFCRDSVEELSDFGSQCLINLQKEL